MAARMVVLVILEPDSGISQRAWYVDQARFEQIAEQLGEPDSEGITDAQTARRHAEITAQSTPIVMRDGLEDDLRRTNPEMFEPDTGWRSGL